MKGRGLSGALEVFLVNLSVNFSNCFCNMKKVLSKISSASEKFEVASKKPKIVWNGFQEALETLNSERILASADSLRTGSSLEF